MDLCVIQHFIGYHERACSSIIAIKKPMIEHNARCLVSQSANNAKSNCPIAQMMNVR